MRPLLVVIIATLILGGVQAFLASDSTPVETSTPQVAVVDSTIQYDVELTLTFDAGPDEFSLSSDDQAASLLLQLNGQPLLRRVDRVLAKDSPIVIRNVEGVVVGRNEFFIQTTPADLVKTPALRIRILTDSSAVADETIWPKSDGVLQGLVAVEVSE